MVYDINSVKSSKGKSCKTHKKHNGHKKHKKLSKKTKKVKLKGGTIPKYTESDINLEVQSIMNDLIAQIRDAGLFFLK